MLLSNPFVKAALSQHIRLHHKKRSEEFPCLQCDRKFRLKSHLDAHVRLSHLVDPRTCEICGKLFDNPQKLKAHIHNVHSGVQKKPKKVDKSDWTCPTCGRIMAAYLKTKHLQTHEEPKYTCDICGKKIKKKTCFDQHMNIHMNVLDHRCEPCNKVFFCHLGRNKRLFSGISIKRCTSSTSEAIRCSSSRKAVVVFCCTVIQIFCNSTTGSHFFFHR